MKAIFTFHALKGRAYWDNPDDFYKYCMENDEQELYCEIKPLSKLSEKQKLYNYLFGPTMDCAVRGYTAAGWEGIDKVKARYMLQAEFAKEEVYNPKTGKVKVVLEDVASMTKERLLKFVVDILFFLESELEQTVPDSSEWKAKLLSGRDFKKVNLD
jgi:hypothetical protein